MTASVDMVAIPRKTSGERNANDRFRVQLEEDSHHKKLHEYK